MPGDSLQTVAAIYVRLSMQNEEELSLVRQEKECTARAVQLGWTPLVFMESKGRRSGRDEKRRPEYRKFKEFVLRDPRCAAIIVYDTDRVSRDLIERLTFMRDVRAKGIKFISIMEPHLDAEMPQSECELMEAMRGASAQHYAAWLAEKARKRATETKLAGGKMGRAPQGLVGVGHGGQRRWAIDPDRIGVVIAILEEYTRANIGAQLVAQRVNARGIKYLDRYGKARRLAISTVNNILDNLEEYDGLLDATLLARARERKLARQSHRENGRMATNKMPILWRLNYCSQCDGRFVVHTHVDRQRGRNAKMVYYFHPVNGCDVSDAGHYYAADLIEDQVWQCLSERFVLTDEQKDYIAKLASEPKADPNASERERLKKRLVNLETALLDGDISKERYRELKVSIDAQLTAMPEPPVSVAVSRADAIERLGAVVTLLQNHSNIDSERINAIFRSMIRKVILQDGKVVKIIGQDWSQALFDEEK